MDKVVRYKETYFDSGAPKFVAGQYYPVTEESTRHVAGGLAEVIEVDLGVEAAQRAADKARAAADRAAAAAAVAKDLAEAAAAAQQLADEALAKLEAKSGITKQLIVAVTELMEADVSLDHASAAAREAEAAADAELNDDKKKPLVDAAVRARAEEERLRTSAANLRAELEKVATSEQIEKAAASVAASKQ